MKNIMKNHYNQTKQNHINLNHLNLNKQSNKNQHINIKRYLLKTKHYLKKINKKYIP